MAVRSLVSVVDDDESVRESLPDLLRAFGLESRVFSSAEEFLASDAPDRSRLLILDIAMPGMTGPDVLKALKKDAGTAGIPVVAFTGLSQKNALRLQQDGACAFLEKSALELDKGCDTLLSALAGIMRQLKLEVPAGVGAPQP